MAIRTIKKGKTVEQKADADAKVQETVRGILADIQTRGDDAVRELSQKFDNGIPQASSYQTTRSRKLSPACRIRQYPTSNLRRNRYETSLKRSARRCRTLK